MNVALYSLARAGFRLLCTLLRVAWPYLASGAVAVLVAHYTPFFGYRAQLEGERAATAVWNAEAKKQKKMAEDNWSGWTTCETTRGVEQERAELSASEAYVRCELAIESARRSAVKIEEIIRVEPERDEAGCPVRSLIDPDGLRAALAGD